jgi:hypothetical protein
MLFHFSYGQRMEYDIILLGKIGKLQINKTSVDEELIISTVSEVKIPFYKFSWITDTKSVNGQLLFAEYKQLLNEKTREKSSISRLSNNSWQFINTEGESNLIQIDNPFYVSQLYFKEPVNKSHIFSERFGKSLQLVRYGNGHYRLLLPDDNYCDYFYENGICKTVKAKNGHRTIKMVLSDES